MQLNAKWTRTEGSSYPLGASYIAGEDAFNFAIYSRHASQVTLLIYDDQDQQNPIYTYNFDWKKNKSNRIWHCRIKGSEIPSGKYYGYKIDGPKPVSQFEWHAFDADKILVDPYARSVYFPPGFDRQAACIRGPNDGKAPLGVLMREADQFDWQGDQFLQHEYDLIIYEVHVRGFTADASSGVTPSNRGTFFGLVEKIPYLLELGVTAVELMPVFQFDSTNNYWGYNPLNFFSPHNQFCSCQEVGEQINQFKLMVRELHKAGIEVILDVVYNHTGEADQFGPTYSFRGIDNSTYYLIGPDAHNPYLNYSGTGNTLHTKNSAVRQMILDSLHFWRSEMHVDGFRVDLTSIFARNADGSISLDEPAILGMISSDPDLATVRFIAEPWDAAGVWHLGKSFPGTKWMQWNSLFRDDVRHFVKSDPGFTSNLLTRIYGSDDLFSDDILNTYHVYQSINFITSHDGFTLYDLVSFNEKHNLANGNNNTDGAANNISWNCGHEGVDTVDPEIAKLRRRQARNFCVLLFVSNGTPMFVAGDEFLRTQRGNNNPYNQDNEISWVDWSLRDKNADFYRFFRQMLAFRKSHPSLSRSRFWREDVRWFSANGNVDTGYNSRRLAFFLDGRREEEDDLYVMINAHWEPALFYFQVACAWELAIDTALEEQSGQSMEKPVANGSYRVEGRSVAVFVRKRDER